MRDEACLDAPWFQDITKEHGQLRVAIRDMIPLGLDGKLGVLKIHMDALLH